MKRNARASDHSRAEIVNFYFTSNSRLSERDFLVTLVPSRAASHTPLGKIAIQPSKSSELNNRGFRFIRKEKTALLGNLSIERAKRNLVFNFQLVTFTEIAFGTSLGDYHGQLSIQTALCAIASVAGCRGDNFAIDWCGGNFFAFDTNHGIRHSGSFLLRAQFRAVASMGNDATLFTTVFFRRTTF